MTDDQAARLAHAFGRRDDEPNLRLAREPAQARDADRVSRVASIAACAGVAAQNDAIKVLCELGGPDPAPLRPHLPLFLERLHRPNKRTVSGALAAVAKISKNRCRSRRSPPRFDHVSRRVPIGCRAGPGGSDMDCAAFGTGMRRSGCKGPARAPGKRAGDSACDVCRAAFPALKSDDPRQSLKTLSGALDDTMPEASVVASRLWSKCPDERFGHREAPDIRRRSQQKRGPMPLHFLRQ